MNFVRALQANLRELLQHYEQKKYRYPCTTFICTHNTPTQSTNYEVNLARLNMYRYTPPYKLKVK